MNSSLLFVFAGGGIGSVLRYLIQQSLNSSRSDEFPFGTFSVNLLGCFLIGCLWGWSEKQPVLSPELKLLLFTGICGGFTTFSAFSQESIQLLKSGAVQPLLAYLVGTLLGSLLVTYLGHKLIS